MVQRSRPRLTTPGDTTENLSCEQCLDVGSREEDGGERSNEDQAGHDGVAVAEAFRNDTVNEQPNDLSALCAIGQASLPLGGDLVRAVGGELAVFAVEGREGVKVADEAYVVACRRLAMSSIRGQKDPPSMAMQVEMRTDHPMALGYSLMPSKRDIFCSFSVAVLAFA